MNIRQLYTQLYSRPRPIMLYILPIMLVSNAQKVTHYAQYYAHNYCNLCHSSYSYSFFSFNDCISIAHFTIILKHHCGIIITVLLQQLQWVCLTHWQVKLVCFSIYTTNGEAKVGQQYVYLFPLTIMLALCFMRLATSSYASIIEMHGPTIQVACMP